jgi:ATP/maltotriose-dependent transcriptional regulator MalT
VILLTRYHTYLVLVLRRGGRVDEVRRATERALSLASEAGMLDYVAAARANQAWVALRDGRRAEAERLVSEARSNWAALAVTYPFQWTALFPALGMALERGDLACAADLSAAMLEEHQARLADEIARPLEDGSRAMRSGDATWAHGCLEEALAAAREHGFA